MARTLAGGTDKIDCGNNAALSPAAVTGCVWLNPSSLANAYTGIIIQVQSVHYYSLYLKSSGKLAIFLSQSGVTYDGSGSHTLTTGTWYHVAFTYDSVSGLVGYVNGASDKTAAANGALGTGTQTLNLGNDPSNAGRHLSGSLANAAIYNAALTANEILALANGALPITVRKGSLVGFWPLDGLSSPEPDYSGNRSSGTLTGTSLGNGPPAAMFTPRWPSNVEPAAAAAFIPAWAQGSNLPVIGTGTY